MKNQPVADNETFVTLMRVAQEEPEVGKMLRAILAQPPFHRRSMLNSLVQDMALEGADRDFVSAVECLLDNDVAAKAVEFLAGSSPQS